jgi:hypothetical protein
MESCPSRPRAPDAGQRLGGRDEGRVACGLAARSGFLGRRVSRPARREAVRRAPGGGYLTRGAYKGLFWAGPADAASSLAAGPGPAQADSEGRRSSWGDEHPKLVRT